MIKAIIFDCFGVLTTDGWLPFKKKYFGHDKKLLQQATRLNELANSRLISYQKFLDGISKLSGVSHQEVRAIVENSIANQELLEYIKSLKPKYKIGLLSNAGADLLEQLFSVEQIKLFDKIVLSYKTGVRKPEARAYQMTAELLGATPAESVFIDDQQKHVQGAVAAGMKAILYKDFKQMKTELEKILSSADN